MKKQTHHIQKQQFNLDFQTDEKARHWNTRFADFYYDDILPHFSSLLDDTVPDDRSYVIDHLEIDLGTIRMDEFRETFLKKAKAELKRVLKKDSISGQSVDETGSMIPEDSVREDYKTSKRQHQKIRDAKQEKNLQVKDRKEHILENFYHFLDYGVLPWNSSLGTLSELEAGIHQEIELEKLIEMAGFRERMRKVPARQRLYLQFSKIFAEDIFNQLYRKERAVLSSLKENLEKNLIRLEKDPSSQKVIEKELSKSIWSLVIDGGPADTREWPQYFIRSAFENLSSIAKPSEGISLFQAIMDEIPQSSSLAAHLKSFFKTEDSSKELKEPEATRDEPEVHDRDPKGPAKKSPENKHDNAHDETGGDSEDDRVQSLSKKRESEGEIGTGDESVQNLSEDGEPGKEIAKETSPGKSGRQEDDEVKDLKKDKSIDPAHAEAPSSEEIVSSAGSETEKEKDQEQSLPEVLEEYYLRNAGIILCWPYLARLFENLEYLEDKTFKEPQYQQRAVHLLGYIGSEEEKCEEHELVLAKFLCAWPLQMPIIRELKLIEEEKNSADEMLSSLISHWSVLKNTSVEGLRESFFSREGKLFKEDEQWKLIVEQESYDMLLDQLPFSISMIKLPWMKEILKVDWA